MAFAQGFYDAYGMHLREGGWSESDGLDDAGIGAAFAAGLRAFALEGGRLGDPMRFLHAADHPHQRRPDFKHCAGCSPPVHGIVCALAGREGAVHALQVPNPAAPGGSTGEAAVIGGASVSWVRVTLEDLRTPEVARLLGGGLPTCMQCADQ